MGSNPIAGICENDATGRQGRGALVQVRILLLVRGYIPTGRGAVLKKQLCAVSNTAIRTIKIKETNVMKRKRKDRKQTFNPV